MTRQLELCVPPDVFAAVRSRLVPAPLPIDAGSGSLVLLVEAEVDRTGGPPAMRPTGSWMALSVILVPDADPPHLEPIWPPLASHHVPEHAGPRPAWAMVPDRVLPS